MAKGSKHHQTQWTGQFGVAYELSRRGYLVTFTLGNAPAVDLICRSPQGVTFSVQVKALSSKNYFLFSPAVLDGPASPADPASAGIYFVLVLIPKPAGGQAEYFVLNHQQLLAALAEEKQVYEDGRNRLGKPIVEFSPGVGYSFLSKRNEAAKWRDCWETLPR
ncbi:MAG TPA: hypothetical protein VHY37_13480 [Tepidisphaeraceae bacterium]|jgi:hypothetical protein|nr:hypothetical protein [Tepidisphaeraceae bacterium]